MRLQPAVSTEERGKPVFGIANLSVDILTVNPTNMNMEQGFIEMLMKFKNGVSSYSCVETFERLKAKVHIRLMASDCRKSIAISEAS